VKKILIVFVMAMMMLLVLAACGDGSSGSGDGPSGNITFFYWDDGQRPAMDNVIEVMKGFAPDVNVESTVIPWGQYWTTLQISLTSASEPDVFWVNKNNSLDYFPAGLVQEISEYIERDSIDMSVFPRALIDLYTYDGKLHAIPKDFDTIALFYNKSLFDAQGLAYPNDSWTWDDLQSAGIALTEGNVFGFAMQPWGQGMVYPFVLSNGGQVMTSDDRMFALDNPAAIAAVQWMVDGMYVHGYSPDGASQLELSPFDRFLAGQIAMLTGGSWSVGTLHEMLGDDLGVARLPISQQPANVIHGLGITMSMRSENKEAAWQLQKAFTMREAGEAQAVAVIPAFTGAESIWVNNFPNLNLQVFIDAAQIATPIPAATVSSAAQVAAVDDAFQSIWMQELDVATAFGRLSEEVAAIVAAAD
jgi:multiple sugar transport system substrate-binding protein